ncbi:MAG: CRISPR-associated endonuclease Cas2 [Bryobacteraceae bacterium]|nr:CRISPR-associated endonuclease Cas2 [Bryobacteraceae bacterium]MCX7602856.1 CRISPR-associated endonuclease Cas2 [Bryobacteraceae bacterium]
MAVSGARCWIIAYDIAEPRRLRQVHAYLVKHAYALQYSVFLAVCTDRQLERILAGLAGQIHHGMDDVRAYPLPEGAEPVCLGVMYSSDFVLLEGLEESARGFLAGG